MSLYLRAPGVEPVRIRTYPKRRPGFMNDTRLAWPASPTGSGSAEPEPCYSDFLAGGTPTRTEERGEADTGTELLVAV